MSWAERVFRGNAAGLLVVLRADALDAGWSVPTGPKRPNEATGPAWQDLHVPLHGPLHGRVDMPLQPAASHEATPAAPRPRDTVAAGFAQLRSQLLDVRQSAGGGSWRTLTVLLAGPCTAALPLPWSDALLQRDSATAHAHAALQAQGFDSAAGDTVCIDTGPPLGQPRTLFWVPQWLAAEIAALASALDVRVASVQALNAVAAQWAQAAHLTAVTLHAGTDPGRRQPGTATALLGSGALQLLQGGTGRGAAALQLGDTLADTATGAPLQPRVAALWQRACIRFPARAAATGLHVLSLDETPPAVAVTAAAQAAQAPAILATPPLHWLRWPDADAGARRSALDRQLGRQARRRPTAAMPQPGDWHRVAVRGLATAVCLLAALVLAGMGWQRQHAAQLLAARAGAVAAAAPATPPTRAEQTEARAVNAAVRQINLQLPALLRALRPPRDLQIVLLGLDLAGPAGDGNPATANDTGIDAIKLSAQAPSGQDMTRYVSFLDQGRGFSSARLARHEQDATAPGGAYRFEMELAWPR